MADWKPIWTICSDELIRLLRPQAESWHEFAGGKATAEAVEQDFAHGELPYLTEISTAIDAWTIDGSWPELSDGALYCIRMRLNAAATFIFLLFDSGEPTQFLSPPSGHSEREVVQWFLTAWWERHGMSYFARQISEVHEQPEDEPELQ